MMFLGSLTVAIAVQHCGLLERIALFIIINIGQSKFFTACRYIINIIMWSILNWTCFYQLQEKIYFDKSQIKKVLF